MGVAGAVSFSTATLSVVYAKEPPPMDLRPKEVVLYQYEACPFCNKVKAFLDYFDIPYKVVEVNPVSKKEIKWSSDYKKVPILVVDKENMVDSSDIINKSSSKIHPEKYFVSSLHEEETEELKWCRWVDNHLVHVLSPNIYQNPSEALESFDYITSHGNFSFTERVTAKYAGAVVMYFVSKIKISQLWDIINSNLVQCASTGSPPSAFQVPYDSFKDQVDSRISKLSMPSDNEVDDKLSKDLDYDFVCFFLPSQR